MRRRCKSENVESGCTENRSWHKCGGPAGIRTLDPRLSSLLVPKAYTEACDCVLILVVPITSSIADDKMA